MRCASSRLRLDKGKKLRPLIEGKPVEPVFRKVADFNSYTLRAKANR